MLVNVATVISAAVFAAETASDSDYGKLIAGGCSAALVAGLFIFSTKHTTASHEKVSQQFADTVDKSNERFATTVKEQAKSFGETTTTLVREGRESNERREQVLQELLRDMRKGG